MQTEADSLAGTASKHIVYTDIDNQKNDLNRGLSARFLERVILPEAKIHLRDTLSPQRMDVEAYLYEQFNRVYHARLCEFLPFLLTLSCHQQLKATVGIRNATDPVDGLKNPLFVENYLDRPLEAELSDLCDYTVNRSAIVEIGNLVATQRGASQLLFVVLAAILTRANYRWVVFTATQKVQQIFSKLRYKPFVLSKAEKARLPDGGVSWGDYYETNPKVMAGYLPCAYSQVMNNSLMRSVVDHYHDLIDNIAEQIAVREQAA